MQLIQASTEKNSGGSYAMSTKNQMCQNNRKTSYISYQCSINTKNFISFKLLLFDRYSTKKITKAYLNIVQHKA